MKSNFPIAIHIGVVIGKLFFIHTICKILIIRAMHFGGAGGTRTPVRIKCQYAFYVCSRVLFVGNQQLRCQPKLVAYSQLVFAWLSRYPTLLCQLS